MWILGLNGLILKWHNCHNCSFPYGTYTTAIHVSIVIIQDGEQRRGGEGVAGTFLYRPYTTNCCKYYNHSGWEVRGGMGVKGTFDMACTETCPLTIFYCCLVSLSWTLNVILCNLVLKGQDFFRKKKTRMLKQTAGFKRHLNSSLSDRHSALTFCPGPLLAHLS